MKFFKKLLSTLLCISFFTLSNGAFALTENSKMSLKEFIKQHKKIQVEYTYPSLKVASKDLKEIPAVNKIKIPVGTPIIVQNLGPINSQDVQEGTEVNFKVLSDVRVGNKVVIKSNTPVSAQVTFAKDRGMVGEPGRITISDFSTKAIDGTYIPLRATLSAKGKDKQTLSLVLGVVVCLPFLLMRGESAQLNAGTTKTIYTAADVMVNFKK